MQVKSARKPSPEGRPEGVTFDIVAVEWERIQVILRLRVADGVEVDLDRFRLEHDEGAQEAMVPTRTWLKERLVVLQFNVMQGPGQDPLRPGRWTLTVVGSRDRRGTPVTIGDASGLDPARDSITFDLVARHYRCRPSVTASGQLELEVTIDPATGAAANSARIRSVSRTRRAIHRMRAILFRIMFRTARAVARRNGRRILFTTDSGAELTDNLQLVHDRMVDRGLHREYDLGKLLRPSIAEHRSFRDRFRMPWLLAHADVIVLDDYQPIIHLVKVDPDVRIVQLWHASGGFKTVGYSRIGKVGGPEPWSRVHKNYTAAIVSSEFDVPYYAEAFGIPESRVIPTGMPRMDRFFDPARAASGREAAHAAFPATRDRFTVLFAPTFRGFGARDATYDASWIDLAALHALAVERDAVVIIRMHPFVRAAVVIPGEFGDRLLDGSSIPIDVNDLLFAVDLLITDYSSIVFEFSALGRPMLFYAPDLEAYVAARDFYVPFEQFVPGRIVRTFDALLDAVRREDYGADRVATFASRHFAHLDGASTDRVIDEVILAG